MSTTAPLATSASAQTVRPRRVYWNYALPITTVHFLALAIFYPGFFTWSGAFLGFMGQYIFGTMGINLCYHRMLTHRSLKVPKWFEHCLVTLSLCSLQDTPVRWVTSHRLHHLHSDEDEDPHTPKDSMFWGHMGWLYNPNPEHYTLATFEKYARDLLQDPWYRQLERNTWLKVYIYLASMVVFFLAGMGFGYVWDRNLTSAAWVGMSWVVWGVWFRTVLVWHITWSVNSLTHIFGYRTYDTDELSRNNWFVALIAAGEGWHNNHHWDPAGANLQHRWWEIDMTYYYIVIMKWVGLAKDIVPPRYVRQAEREMASKVKSF